MEIADENLTPDEEAACVALTRALLTLPRIIDDELIRSIDLTLSEYTVVRGLADSPRRATRVSDLVVWVPMSRSGLTRLVDRLARDGFVERERSADDRRAQMVVLTDAGRKLAETGKAAHETCLRRLILDNLGGLDLRRLTFAFDAMGARPIL